MTEESMMKQVDALLDEGKAKEAEDFMLEAYDRAQQEENGGLALAVRNEQIGYYRATSQKDKLLPILTDTILLAQDLGLEGTIPYATTILNVANGYRSVGNLELSKRYYLEAEQIYQDQPEIDSMLLAGLYNNMSLLWEELGEYEEALLYQQKALEIAVRKDAGFEIAATYSNIANTLVALGRRREAEESAAEAIKRFRTLGSAGPHYCAALHALGLCHYQKEEYAVAAEYFAEAMELVERSVGRNSQYERLQEYYLLCKEKSEINDMSEKGMVLSRRLYEEKGAGMLQRLFPAYVDRIAVGLVGQGSDCYGYDDAISADHDFGPGFCMWVTRETYEEIGSDLEKAYKELIAQEEKELANAGSSNENLAKRRGVFVIEEFYKKLLGVSGNLLELTLDTPDIEEYALATVTNGEVFRDEEGIFTAIREHLQKGYTKSFRLQKLAQDMAEFSQNLQYNYYRMMDRGDFFTADLMLANGMKAAMRLQHHICGKYAPHDKWLKRSLLDLPAGLELISLLDNLRGLCGCTTKETYRQNKPLAERIMEEIAGIFVEEMYGLDDISDIDTYLDHHTEELMMKSFLERKTDEELVNMVVKLEFEAFDKVQNEGGRASCQNNWPTFYVMRKSQYLTWSRTMLLQYYYDFDREYRRGHNLITEKYGRMMESTAPEKYEEIKEHFPEISEQKKAVINQIVSVQMGMAEEFAAEYPAVAGNARELHTYEDNYMNTSMETYLRGEISTYSDKMLQLYGQYVVKYVTEGRRIAQEIIENTAKMYGYKSLEEFAAR